MRKLHQIKAITLFATGLPLAGHAYAQISYLSDNRSVSTYGYRVYQDDAEPHALHTNDVYSHFQTPASPYSDFQGNVSDNTYSSIHSSASQDSGLMPNQIQFSSSIYVLSSLFWSLQPSGPLSPYAQHVEASSSFAVTFSVSSPLEYTLSTDWSYSQDFTEYSVPNSGGCTLVSASQGLIWQSLPLQVTWPINNGSRLYSFSGVLEPGNTYTLSVSMTTYSYYTDTPPTTGNYGADVVLATVPEPNSLMMLALGLPMLACLRRRQA